jgi:hypothetical protein
MPTPSIRRRIEARVPARLFVKLAIPDTGEFEITQTVDISLHGARVLSKHFWRPNDHLVLRCLRGNFTSYARVVHCHFLSDQSYALGLQLLNPAGAWPIHAPLPVAS